MTRLRVATWNVEWFDALFDRHDRLLRDHGWSKRQDVTRRQQGDAVARVLEAVDPDVILIVEGPNEGRKRSAVRALEGFAKQFHLRQRKALLGFPSPTHQELVFLYDPDRVALIHDPKGVRITAEGWEERREAANPAPPFDALAAPARRLRHAPRFDGVFPMDVDGDGETDLHVFSKPPNEVAAQDLLTGARFRMIGVHAKSKAAFGADNAADARRIAAINRRKQLAQCAWIRQRVEDHLATGEDVIVLGDFNDGPGQDHYEKAFGRSGVEVVMGDPGHPETLLRNPYTRVRYSRPYGWRPSTARFYHRDARAYVNALLDFVMISPALADRVRPRWRIWHPFDDAECFADEALKKALLTASDHFPVSVDMESPADA